MAQRVPFFSNEVKAPTAHKADALFVPRENPRAFVISPLVHASLHEYVNDHLARNGTDKEGASSAQSDHKPNGQHNLSQKGSLHIRVTGCEAGEAAILKERTADVEAIMPRLRRSDYYTEPQIQELAAKERAERFLLSREGFCGRTSWLWKH
ncbi:hypothetical protein U1Q18_002787 [Sarracenia purpurea var. burkii]